MSTDIRPEISTKNKYWISRHRYYELKHFCLQYSEWKKLYSKLELDSLPKAVCISCISSKSGVSNPTEDIAILKAECKKRIDMVERAASSSDEDLAQYILKAVTESISFENLQTKHNIPCCRDTFYDRYRKFFWVLNGLRG